MKYQISICIAAALVGLITGLSLGWLQWISIKDLGAENPGKIITKVYVLSSLRILFVSGILFLGFRQGLIYGLILLITFIIGRWTWTLLALNRKSKYKE